jgi:hypothetical protein
MEEQPTNSFPTLREVQEMKEEQQEHAFPPPKPYVEEEESIKRTTPSDRESTIIARAILESTVGAL